MVGEEPVQVDGNDWIYEIYDEMMAQGAWRGHCYNFEYMHMYEESIAEYLDGNGLDGADDLRDIAGRVNAEFDRVAGDPRKSFMNAMDIDVLESLDDEYMDTLARVMQTVSDHAGAGMAFWSGDRCRDDSPSHMEPGDSIDLADGMWLQAGWDVYELHGLSAGALQRVAEPGMHGVPVPLDVNGFSCEGTLHVRSDDLCYDGSDADARYVTLRADRQYAVDVDASDAAPPHMWEDAGFSCADEGADGVVYVGGADALAAVFEQDDGSLEHGVNVEDAYGEEVSL